MEAELFESAVRAQGDLAGVFEFEGETGYFYLYGLPTHDREEATILGHIFIAAGEHGLLGHEIVVEWDFEEQRVGLFIDKILWAVFNVVTGAKHGGQFRSSGNPQIPAEESFLYASRH